MAHRSEQVLAVELANRESRSSWKEFLEALRVRGLHGVEFVVSDDHPGLKKAIAEVLAGVCWQRCYVHFLRNALDYVPRKVDDDCLLELRWMYDRRDLSEVRRDLAAWLGKWSGKYPKLTGWVEDNIEETLTYFRLPLAHRKHMKSTNMLERLNEEIRRRTYVVRIFPNGEKLPETRQGAHRRAPRGLARRPPLSEHGSVEGAQEGDAQGCRLTMLRPTKGMDATPLRRRRSPALRFGQASDGGSEGMALPDPVIDFAELDAHNSFRPCRPCLRPEP
jgi:hypothetical protein